MEDRMMMAYDPSNPGDFHTDEYKSKITSIVTKGDTVIPEGVIESWDISEKQNGSVIAYVEDDGTGSGTYKVTIGGEGSIIANYDMTKYFQKFENCTTMDLTYLDTSLVTNMYYMFMKCSSLTELDLSNFDTSKVTNMAMMFTMCSKLTTINLSSFDTSNVTTIDSMFWVCSNLTELDLTSFDTSNVTEYTLAFASTTNIKSILVTRDTWTIPNSTIANSGVTDFTYM